MAGAGMIGPFSAASVETPGVTVVRLSVRLFFMVRRLVLCMKTVPIRLRSHVDHAPVSCAAHLRSPPSRSPLGRCSLASGAPAAHERLASGT